MAAYEKNKNKLATDFTDYTEGKKRQKATEGTENTEKNRLTTNAHELTRLKSYQLPALSRQQKGGWHGHKRSVAMFVICWVILFFTCNVYAEKSIGTLMEEATYQEETVGDVNAAIGIYEKVIADDEARRPQVARATYRAGMCYLKKGDKDKAAQLFNDVVAKFADQKVFVSKAQKELTKINPTAGASGVHVVSTMPGNFANDVDPSLDKISVTFNTPMRDKSWAWCKMGENYPEISGAPSYDTEYHTCTLSVKLQPGTAYMVGFNIPPYIGFHSQDGQPAKTYILVFATKDAAGKPTIIPEHMAEKAKEVIAEKSFTGLTQEMQNDIDPNGTIYFKSPVQGTNSGSEPISEFNFMNSDFVFVTKMVDQNSVEVPFETTHDGNVFRYKVKLNAPIMPGTSASGYTEGYMKGLIKPVSGLQDVYEYYMRHSPSAGQPVLRIETYLLPKGAELITTTPKSIKVGEENGRIKLSLEEIIPANSSLITSFQYKLTSGKIVIEPGDVNKAVERAVMTISTCAEGDPRIKRVMEPLKSFDDTAVVKELVKYLSSDENTVRRSAIYILWRGEFSSIEPAIAELEKLCLHTEDFTRGMAALTLGQNKVKSSFAILEKMTLEDKSGYARRCGAYALGLLGDPKAKSTLEKAANDSDKMVQDNAKAALRMFELNPPAAKANAAPIQDLIKEMHNPNAPRFVALNALVDMGEPAVEPLIAELAKSNDWQTAKALGAIKDKRAVKPLIEKWQTADFSPMKEVIAEALESITGQKFGADLAKWQEWEKTQSLMVPVPQAAIDAAMGWLKLVDNGDYKASWKEAASAFKAVVTADSWKTSATTARAPLGKLISRELKSKTYTKSLPGAPDGEYVVIEFAASFENKKSAVETVTPMLDKDGKWRVSGYYVK